MISTIGEVPGVCGLEIVRKRTITVNRSNSGMISFLDLEFGSARVLMCNGFVLLLVVVDTREAVLVFILELLVP